MDKEEQKRLITEIMNEDAKDDIIQLAKESWEGCQGCDENDRNFWINGFTHGYIRAKEEEKNFNADELKAAYNAGYMDGQTNHINDANNYISQLQYSKSDELKWTRLSDNSSGSPIIK